MASHTTTAIGNVTLVAIDESFDFISNETIVFSVFELTGADDDSNNIVPRQRVLVSISSKPTLAEYIGAAAGYQGATGVPVDAVVSYLCGTTFNPDV